MIPVLVKSVWLRNIHCLCMLFKVSNNLVQIYRSFSITGNYGRRSFSKLGGCFIALMERTRSSPFSFFCEEELFGRSPTSSFSKGSLAGRDTWSNMAAYSIQNVDIECELCKRLFPGFTKFAGHPCVSNGMFIRHIY